MSGSPPPSDFHELRDFLVDPASVRLLKFKYCLANRVVVLGRVDPDPAQPVTLAMLDPGDMALRAEVEARLRRPVRPVRLSSYEIRRALNQGYALDEEESEYRLTLKPVGEITFDEDVPVAHVLSEVLGRAVHMRATDVHVETYEDDVDVRFRVDGVLQQVATPLNRENVAAAVSRLKVLADLDIGERRRAQDGRIIAVYEDEGGRRNIDCRISVVPGPFGEDAVLRVLDSAAPLLGLGTLGLPAELLPRVEELIRNPEGLLLVTGPTGSGKTTTLYAFLQRLRGPARKILTVEDPIEYTFAKVNQKQVGPAMGFAAFARAFMRQNPDVILIGEIRDEETADVALRAAQTGHLVLSTLHTGDAVRVVSRLRTLGVDPNLLAGSLLGSLSQRLVRRLCPACRQPAPPDEREARLLALPADPVYFRAPGCPACAGLGYRGRLGLYELFVPGLETADLITSGVAMHQLRGHARATGMRTLLEDGLDKARAGLTSLAEILRVVPQRLIAAERA